MIVTDERKIKESLTWGLLIERLRAENQNIH